ncbi:MAG: iron-sulfur cluster insertion protein ErpA [Halomonas sp.]|jgi:iron-sulfur cluster insertion protein|uniref:Iron-sulfur cluster insertion protein ErpA n=1 Tax=Billgrantia tianxiuensis TaxID=2497861 RepID=A0A6I6SMU1_9GAMM|nr:MULTISPECIES: iron-sulfur cluster insertion protein ErpA [Halomonas]MCE8035234.1 iron-sulfur cluster insertion protein ErpA [Halomonas sp. MCCC 1A11057]MDX5434755.1 iron-sulfur cluster insertion protein ErpA [Halomonas sp.]QHC51949.1 iron-sulfur cluster insertion protein ErpA [Halomonas tianxiuensis]
MSGAQSFVPTPMMLSEAASKRLKALIEEEGKPDLKLRVYVTGGGCSGFQYGFDFAESVGEDDTLIEFGEVALVVDELSYQYLVGSTVDYEEGLAGARFLVQNPNATTTCGCGASFMV